MTEMPHILLFGGTGTFGHRIALALAQIPNIHLTLASRHVVSNHHFDRPQAKIDAIQLDVNTITTAQLIALRPQFIINAVGPFHLQNYNLPKACIDAGCHYLDLADNRAYVTNITTLDEAAKNAHVSIITGASTVPALSAAVIDHFLPEFSALESVTYDISPGNQTERGIGTVASILSYTGKAFQTLENGQPHTVYGWQDLHLKALPQLGRRWMSRCDIPDLTLFPSRYPSLRTLRFYAGLELSLLHLGLWFLAGLVRLGLPLNLPRHAALLRKISLWFYSFGSDHGGMHMFLQGRDDNNQSKNIYWFLQAKAGDGPQIPVTAAIILIKKWLAGETFPIGAQPCLGLFTLDEFLNELKDFSITQGVT
jgi:hypothetical protein